MRPFHFFTRAFILALIGGASDSVAAGRTTDPHDPAVELESFQVADAFEVNLFASEKDGVVKPIQIRFDAQGRLWVIGSGVYPLIEPGRTPNDKVLILEDTNRDGVSDRTTVFADGLMIPTGIELTRDGVLVGHGTELLFLPDKDGDGKADERRVMLNGFGTGDNHQNINSFLWGPGGELWICQGLHTRSRIETPWGIVQLAQAGLWRLRPRLLRLDGFYGSAHEPQNPWGFAFTDWGEPIVIAGNNSSHIYPVPGFARAHRDDPPPLIWKYGSGRKSSGGDIVGTTHFPPSWQGLLITGGYINNAVWALKICEDGAGFALEDLPPLIRSTNRNFRPVDVKFGPEGALYICDWYNPIIGHYQASFRHPDRDKTHGRIWRVTAKGRRLAERPLLVGKTATELLDHLKSPDRWTRHFAKRVLADLPTKEVITALEAWASQPDLSEHALTEALGVYQSHEVIAPDLVSQLCQAADPGARAYAASVVGAWADGLPNALELLRGLVIDEAPRVRLHAVVACSYVPKSEAMEVAARAADFPIDKFLNYALRQAVFALKPHWLPALRMGKLNLENSARRLSLLVGADGTPDTLLALRSLSNSTALDAAARETFLRTLADIGSPDDLAMILQLNEPSLQARLLPVIATSAGRRQERPTGDLPDAVRQLLDKCHEPLRAEALKLAGIWKLEPLRPTVESIALDETVDENTRRAAVEALASLGGEASKATLQGLASRSPARVQSAAIAGLCSIDLGMAAQAAGRTVARLNDESALIEIFSAFLRRRKGGAALADIFSSMKPPKQVAEIGLRVMSSSGRRDEALAPILSQAAGYQGTHPISPEELAAFVSEVRARGDAKKGAEIFRRPQLGCLACHAIDGQGGNLGSDLSALGTAQPVDFIIGAILEPQKEVKEGYMSLSLISKEGDEYQGYLVRETADELVLRDVLQNKEIHLRRDQINESRQGGSIMPPGLVDTLSRSEFRDLVRFLSELGAPK